MPDDETLTREVAPRIFVYGRLVTESDVRANLRDLGDQALADYESGRMSMADAYRSTAAWLRNSMEMPR
jgi:hypothetical protein